MRRWLVGRFYLMDDKPPSAQALTDALGALEAKAQFGGRVHDVHVRLAGVEGANYLDLANPKWEVVEVTARGWRLITDPPVKFRRAKGMLPLPDPAVAGTLTELRKFVNVRDDSQRTLLIAWALAALRPSGPYPVLNLTSEHGSGKTTTGEVLRRLIDPNSAMLRAEPRDVRDVMIAATNSWMVAFDNLSELQPWLSDCLCRLSTGGGFSTRELYTDMDEMIFSAQRPALLNGIEEIVTRGDLLDRSLLLDLPPIPEDRRRSTGEFWRSFDAARPRLLGALLEAVSMALRRERTIRLAKLPRMADFAIWATAAAPALGWSDNHFVSIYTANREQAHELALDASPVAAALRASAELGDWSGTAAELLEALTAPADDADVFRIERGDESILIVEDDALVREYVVTQISSLGYDTLAASNAAEALEIIDGPERVDLLFTDVIMPGGMNGRQLATEAIKRRQGLKVLYTSGYTENAIVHHGRLDAGVLLLAKPYLSSDLARMIRTALAL